MPARALTARSDMLHINVQAGPVGRTACGLRFRQKGGRVMRVFPNWADQGPLYRLLDPRPVAVSPWMYPRLQHPLGVPLCIVCRKALSEYQAKEASR